MMEQLTPQQIADNWIVWLDALASGQYKKTFGTLHRTMDGQERHCCLGVAQICLGLNRTDQNVDDRLIPLLGLDDPAGRNSMATSNEDKRYITLLNDHVSSYRDDDDFVNMHHALLTNLEGFTHLHPEVAPLVRKKLAERI